VMLYWHMLSWYFSVFLASNVVLTFVFLIFFSIFGQWCCTDVCFLDIFQYFWPVILYWYLIMWWFYCSLFIWSSKFDAG
jgi:hypothetical protein